MSNRTNAEIAGDLIRVCAVSNEALKRSSARNPDGSCACLLHEAAAALVAADERLEKLERDSIRTLASVILAAGGEVAVSGKIASEVDRHAVVRRYHDSIKGAEVFEVKNDH